MPLGHLLAQTFSLLVLIYEDGNPFVFWELRDSPYQRIQTSIQTKIIWVGVHKRSLPVAPLFKRIERHSSSHANGTRKLSENFADFCFRRLPFWLWPRLELIAMFPKTERMKV